MMEIETKFDHCQFTGIELILAHFGICRGYVVSEFTWNTGSEGSSMRDVCTKFSRPYRIE